MRFAIERISILRILTIDRPLDESDRQALRALSTRARITATQFVNSYQWGDFKGDPAKLMKRWFDLHLYFANWGTRRLMLRLPKRFVDVPGLGPFLDEADGVTIRSAGDNLVFDILSEDEDPDEYAWDDEWGDGSGLLAALAPLRSELINGDLRLFYLLWLRALEAGALDDDASEPLPGIGPLTASLQVFADFVRIDPDLLQAAAESEAADLAGPSARSVKAAVAELPDVEKNAFLVRLFNSDPYAGVELQRLLRRRLQPEKAASRRPPRTARALRARAEALRLDRARAKAEAAAAQRIREAEKQRRVRLDALARRGEAVWRDIEIEINRRNASGYAKAVGLLSDLKALAAKRGLSMDFDKRLAAIRERHAQKGRFIERLAAGEL